VSTKEVVLAIVIPSLIAELGPWCGWLAEKLLLFATSLRYGDDTDRATDRAEEWSGHLREIPGQLSKLMYALGQLAAGSTVAARRKIKNNIAGMGIRDQIGYGSELPARVILWLASRRTAPICGATSTITSGSQNFCISSAELNAGPLLEMS
jgi:hypothetical protein